MAKIETILDEEVSSYEYLDAMLTAMQRADRLTASQYRMAKDSLKQFVPSRIVVQQRTPKSVTIFKAGAHQVRITNRARAYVEVVIL